MPLSLAFRLGKHKRLSSADTSCHTADDIN